MPEGKKPTTSKVRCRWWFRKSNTRRKKTRLERNNLVIFTDDIFVSPKDYIGLNQEEIKELVLQEVKNVVAEFDFDVAESHIQKIMEMAREIEKDHYGE